MDQIQNLVNSSAQPFMTVNASCQLHRANPQAQHELQKSRCLSLYGSHIQTTFAADQGALLTAVERAISGQRSMVRLRVLPKSDDSAAMKYEVLLLVTPLDGHSDLVVLQLERTALCDPSLLCLLSRSYRLTKSEERVLSLLCDGQDVTEIAQTLAVATSTIRSHVIALRNKTAVSSIRQLIQRIALLPAVCSASTDK
jgi:DNA-binding NarL/FixJ family response regulator